MGIVKHRPRIRVRAPSVIVPSQSFEAEVTLEARREVPLSDLKATLIGHERVQQSHLRLTAIPKSLLGPDSKRPYLIHPGRTTFKTHMTLPAESPATYAGSLAAVWYELEVHADIPWWPDARRAFTLKVGERRRPAPEGKPMTYSTAPNGAAPGEPYMELSLLADVAAQGDAVAGAFALGNVPFDRRYGVELRFLLTEHVPGVASVHRALSNHVVARFQVSGTESQEFTVRVPDVGKPSVKWPRWELRWYLQARARISGIREVVLSAPLTVVSSDVVVRKDETARARLAPPSVGSERINRLWSAVAVENGLQLDSSSNISGEWGQTRIAIHREHSGRDGIRMIAELAYPSLHLDLHITPATAMSAVLWRGHEVGHAGFDRRYQIDGRSKQQIRALLMDQGLVWALEAFREVRLDDEKAQVWVKDAGTSPKNLGIFVKAVTRLAREMEKAREQIPPPERMADQVEAWQAVAARLRAPLETARMAVEGKFDGAPAWVRTEWSTRGEALHTAVELRPTFPISQEHIGRAVAPLSHLEALLRTRERKAGEGEKAAEELPEMLRRYPAEALIVLPKLLAGARGFEVQTDLLTVLLDAPLEDPQIAVDRLGLLARLAMTLRAGAGPYR